MAFQPLPPGLRTPRTSMPARSAAIADSDGYETVTKGKRRRRQQESDLPFSPMPMGALPDRNPLAPAPKAPESMSRLAAHIAQHAAVTKARHEVFLALSQALDAASKRFTKGAQLQAALEFHASFEAYLGDAINGGIGQTPNNQPQQNAARHVLSHSTTSAQGPALTAGPGDGRSSLSYANVAAQRAPETAPTARRQQKTIVSGSHTNVEPKEDLRLFLRLDEQSPAWRYESFQVRAMIAEALQLPLADLPTAAKVRTGWAIRPRDELTRKLLLTRETELKALVGCDTVEASQVWHTYCIEEVPTTITDWKGERLPMDQAVLEEAIAQTGQRPLTCHRSQHYDENLASNTWIVAFANPLKTRFCVFGRSRLSRPVKRKFRLAQCENCWEFYETHRCNHRQHCR